ncbi:MAG: hypothetical protein CM15mP49_31510 [Actinomycetota bacterium]|nr:MAG: hypothetical protein CM15mP49_31510 [Actinomycetota bacterium]
MGKSRIRIGLLGYGTVGSAFVDLLESQKSTILLRTGLELVVTHVAVSDLNKDRPGLDAQTLLTDKPSEVIKNNEVDLVVELMGGLLPARDLVKAALENNKPVITANKELLSKEGNISSLAGERNVDLLFEAAVAGGIPLIRVLRQSLLGSLLKRSWGSLMAPQTIFFLKWKKRLCRIVRRYWRHKSWVMQKVTPRLT